MPHEDEAVSDWIEDEQRCGRSRCVMIAKQIIPLLLAVLPNVVTAGASKPGPQAGIATPVSIQGSWAGIEIISQIIREYESDQGSHFIRFTPRDSNQVPGALKKCECDVGMILDSLASGSSKDFRTQFKAFPLGRFVVYAAVNAKTPAHAITLDELRNLFRGQVASWKDVNNAGSIGRIELFAPLGTMVETSIFQKKVMGGAPFAKGLMDRSVTTRHQRPSATEIIGAIAKQPNAIGFFLAPCEEHPDARIRILRIAIDNDSDAVPPSLSTVADGSYPLVDTLKLYLHHNAPVEANEFCKFATGPEAVKIVKQFGLWPEYELDQARGKQRLPQ
jgi:ABC-type phosphate transport system substrate-binding protein